MKRLTDKINYLFIIPALAWSLAQIYEMKGSVIRVDERTKMIVEFIKPSKQTEKKAVHVVKR